VTGLPSRQVKFTTKFGSLDEPYIRLDRRAWDDFGFQSLFEIILHAGNEAQPLGSIKILQRGETRTELPQTFETLPETYCGLGQSLRYDREVKRVEQEFALDLSLALRDIRRLTNQQRTMFTGHPGFECSLIRFAPARLLYAYEFGDLAPTLDVDLRVDLPGFNAAHELKLEFDPDRLLGRVAVIIGENGTGKTRLLNEVAKAMSGVEPKWISRGAPSVSRVIALSCNAFDQFEIPKPMIEDTYHYIGLRSKKDNIDVKGLGHAWGEVFRDGAPRRGHPRADRFELWRDVLNDIGLGSLAEEDMLGSRRQEQAFERLGAGLKFACYVLTRLVQMVEPRSFVLFDEPETHTHPRLLSSMMRALHRVLDNFESFALVATHSPLVVQEVPARQVHILRCFEDYPNFSPPLDETFGASLGELLRKTFLIDYHERNFDVLLHRLVEQHGAARVRVELGDDLGLAARLLLEKLDPGQREGDVS